MSQFVVLEFGSKSLKIHQRISGGEHCRAEALQKIRLTLLHYRRDAAHEDIPRGDR